MPALVLFRKSRLYTSDIIVNLDIKSGRFWLVIMVPGLFLCYGYISCVLSNTMFVVRGSRHVLVRIACVNIVSQSPILDSCIFLMLPLNAFTIHATSTSNTYIAVDAASMVLLVTEGVCIYIMTNSFSRRTSTVDDILTGICGFPLAGVYRNVRCLFLENDKLIFEHLVDMKRTIIRILLWRCSIWIYPHSSRR